MLFGTLLAIACIHCITQLHQHPKRSGSMFLNYKHYFSIVLMAVIDTNYNYIFIDVGAYGKECDSNVFKETAFWKSLVNKTLNLPKPAQLEESNIDLPYIFVGDEAFALHENILRPFSGQLLNATKSVFNYRWKKRVCVKYQPSILALNYRLYQGRHQYNTILWQQVQFAIILRNTLCLSMDEYHGKLNIVKNLLNIYVYSNILAVFIFFHIRQRFKIVINNYTKDNARDRKSVV